MSDSVRPEKIAELAARLSTLGVRDEDLVEKFVRSSGPGGQKVNKTSTAVYLKHLPTGIEVKIQTSRSQSLNRFLARRQLADELEALRDGKQSVGAQRIVKARRQKDRRARRARKKALNNKHEQHTQ